SLIPLSLSECAASHSVSTHTDGSRQNQPNWKTSDTLPLAVLACLLELFFELSLWFLSPFSIYALAVTSQPVGGATETLCVQVYPFKKPLALVVTLEHDKNSRVLLKRNAITQDYYQCVPFKVPDVDVESKASVNVQITGDRTSLNKTTQILIKPPTQLILIQTDKPIYKPGQTGTYQNTQRMWHNGFYPTVSSFPTIELQDPNLNRIGQWLNQSTTNGILDLSYPMNPEAQQGDYVITLWNMKNEPTTGNFEIKNYVLPKFEVIVQLPPVITVLDSKVTLTACANYTYGKPVNGSVTAVVCRKHYRYWWFRAETARASEICKTYSMTTDKTGCGSSVLNMAEFALTDMGYEDVISVECEVEEYGTGVVLKGSGSSTITSDIVTLTFEDTPEAFKLGMAYTGKVKAAGPNSVPVKNKSVYLTVRYGGDKNMTWTLVTNENGTAPFSLDTLLWGSDGVSLEASSRKVEEPFVYVPNVRQANFLSAYHWVQPFYSKSNSFLELLPSPNPLSCSSSAVVEAQYIIPGDETKPGQKSMNFFFLVMSKGSMVQYGSLSAPMRRGTVNKGKLTISLQQVNTMSPIAQVVVYTVLPSGEAVADSRDFPVQLCLTNKVSLAFSSPTELPGGQTSLTLKAQPRSLCSVRAIDRSVLLLRPERKLSIESIFDLLPVQKMSGYPYSITDQDPYPCFGGPPIMDEIPDREMMARPAVLMPEVPERPERRVRPFFYPFFTSKLDVYNVFKSIGVKILTNAEVRKPVNCRRPTVFSETPIMDGPAFFAKEAAAGPEMDAGSKSKPVRTVRTFFPETWIWDLVPVGRSGDTVFKKTVPGTITTWSAEAFCTSSVGFGVAPTVELTTFQPFFVSLTLPNSIIRGETFVLKATVFNYLRSCIMVKVTLANSQQFSAQQCPGCQYTRCLCADQSWTFTWNIQPSVLGTVSFNVTAEALQTSALCENKPVTVPNKGRMDTVVQTLLVEAEGTKQVISYNEMLCPTGVAVERNVSLKLPDVIVKGSATASVSVLGRTECGPFLKNLLAMPYGCGEQNMLRFAPNIFILQYLQSSGQLTPEIRKTAETFLVSGYQRELTYKHDDGSYSAFGMSDPSGNTWLTAFVMKSFGSAKQFVFIDQLYVDQAKAWLGQQQQSKGYFASVGQLFHSDMKGGVSDEVTLTAYITAALLELGTPTTDPMVVNSLAFLRNAFTELNSTYATALLSYAFSLAGDQDMRSKSLAVLDKQVVLEAGGRHWKREMDTVVALQALAKYSAATYSPAGTFAVTMTAPSGQKTSFTINQSNRLLVQESSLQTVPADYKVRAEGQGCVLVQFTVRYNIPPPPDNSSFSISAKTVGNCNAPMPSVNLSVSVSYNGKRMETNMVILDIKLLSGFRLDEESLSLSSDTLELNKGAVKRVDKKDGSVIIYLDGLRKGDRKTYSLVLLRDTVVQNLKPAVMKVYDYYETSKNQSDLI
ncbi:hypothetical protein NFI96_022087, partial [Prochilodus magdalenae]